MKDTTRADRERELRNLLEMIKEHPEHPLTEQRERAAVLQRMLGESAVAEA